MRIVRSEPSEPRLSRRRALATWIAVSIGVWLAIGAVVLGVARWERHAITTDAEHLSRIAPASGDPASDR